MSNSTTTTQLIPELQVCVDAFAEDKQTVAQKYADLTDEEFNRRPKDGGWSVAECLEHLSIIADLYIPRLEAAIDEAEREGWHKEPPYKRPLIGRYFVKSMNQVPPKLKMKTFKSMQPASDLRKADVLTRFATRQDELSRLAVRANGLDLGRMRVASPITSLIKLSVSQAFQVLSGHQKRHLWQADQVLVRE